MNKAKSFSILLKTEQNARGFSICKLLWPQWSAAQWLPGCPAPALPGLAPLGLGGSDPQWHMVDPGEYGVCSHSPGLNATRCTKCKFLESKGAEPSCCSKSIRAAITTQWLTAGLCCQTPRLKPWLYFVTFGKGLNLPNSFPFCREEVRVVVRFKFSNFQRLYGRVPGTESLLTKCYLLWSQCSRNHGWQSPSRVAWETTKTQC